MDLRTLPPQDRNAYLEKELGEDLSKLKIEEAKLGLANEKNCEQMFGAVPIPVGYAGPLAVTFSDGATGDIHLPLATTEGALVASINRGCKALSQSGGITITHIHHGISRSIALKTNNSKLIREKENEWKQIGEATSEHLKIMSYDIDEQDGYTFLTIYADTDEAMGMNMVTIAAQAIGNWIAEHLKATLITVAGNVDSDKKPCKRTKDKGRGYEVIAEATLTEEVITNVLKTTPEAMLEVARAKLETGSNIAGAIGSNLHAANVIAALYLATGQDAAHVVEGSLADTTIETQKPRNPETNHRPSSLKITVRIPAILIGIRGGGTDLPAQKQCRNMILKPKTELHPCAQLAESIGAAVLAGEVSLLAAQSAQHLAIAHHQHGRSNSL